LIQESRIRDIQGANMQKKFLLAGFFAICVMALASVPVRAQDTQSGQGASSQATTDTYVQMLREDVRGHRKEITAANMPLTPDEATKFWPVYDQYVQETDKINDTRLALIKDYANNYDAMTDQQAHDYIKRGAEIDQQRIAARAKYASKFEKVVSPKKTALWSQIDRRLDLIIDLQLAASLPVVDASK